MRITKFGHSCVRLSHEGRDVVIDPGVLSEPEAVDGVAAVLVTHEHADHWTVENLRAADAPVYTIEAVARQLRGADPAVAERVVVLRPGEEREIAGFAVRVVGEKHAVIHPELPTFDNSGYVVSAGGESVYHPGDSFELPGGPVDVFCAPVCAPWASMAQLVDLARDVAAARTLGIHDRVYSDFGLAIADDRFRAFLEPLGSAYRRPASGGEL